MMANPKNVVYFVDVASRRSHSTLRNPNAIVNAKNKHETFHS